MDASLWERLMAWVTGAEETVAGHTLRIDSLRDWNERQDAALAALAERVERLEYGLAPVDAVAKHSVRVEP